jgi:hypothetical protein
MKTRYPHYDVLAKWDSPSFDEPTRAVLARRLKQIPQRHFFSADEALLLDAIVARVLPQPERVEPIPITPWIDDLLYRRRGEGFRHDNMPPLPEAWRLGLGAIDAEARQRHGRGFAALDDAARDALLEAIARDEVAPGLWQRVPAQRFFIDILVKTAAGVYYSHPAAWSEIGFGGPASPRGYVRLGFDSRDAWEAKEER